MNKFLKRKQIIIIIIIIIYIYIIYINITKRNQVEKRIIMDNMDVVFLAIDECLDEGYLLINLNYYFKHIKKKKKKK